MNASVAGPIFDGNIYSSGGDGEIERARSGPGN
jgi:hypothetical protein